MSYSIFERHPYNVCVMFVSSRAEWARQIEHFGHKGLAWPTNGAGIASATRLIVKGCSPAVLVIANRALLRRMRPAELANICAHEATHVMRYVCENMSEDFLGWEAEAHLVGACTEWLYKIVVDDAVN